MIILTRSSEKIFNPSRYTGNKIPKVEWFFGAKDLISKMFGLSPGRPRIKKIIKLKKKLNQLKKNCSLVPISE